MKKSSILFAALAVVAVSCEKPDVDNDDNKDNNNPTVIAVESVNLDASLSSGLTLEIEGTYDLAAQVTVLPADATDKTVTYFSSAETIATVSDAGLITAVAEGTAVITVSAGDKSTTLNVTVNPAPPVNITAIAFKSDAPTAFETNLPVNLVQYIEVTPAVHEDAVTFSSSAEAVATVSAEGVLTIKSVGTAKITVAAASDNTKKAELDITVARLEYARFPGDNGETARTIMPNDGDTKHYDDMPHTDGGWSVSDFGQIETEGVTWANTGARNSYRYAMFDNRLIGKRTGGAANDLPTATNGTAFCWTNPSRTEADGVYFVVDMQTPLIVNYFRVVNISNDKDDRGVFLTGVSEIMGSNDATTWTSLGTDIRGFNPRSTDTHTDDTVYYLESQKAKFTNSTAYRYIKFVMNKQGKCYGYYVGDSTSSDKSAGSVQVAELYMGYDPTL